MSDNKDFLVKVKMSQIGVVGVKGVATEQEARDRVFKALRFGETTVEEIVTNKDLMEFTIIEVKEVAPQ